jgi:hypothetical protein
MLARWFNPLRWSAVRSDASTRYPAYTQFFIPSRDFPPFKPSRSAAGRRSPRDMVWRLVLWGLFYGVLALSLPDLASPAVGEVMGSQHPICLGSGAFPVLSRAETCLLAPYSRPAAPANEPFSLDDRDVDDNDALLTFRTHFVPLAPVCRVSPVRCLPASGHSATWRGLDSSHAPDPSGREGLIHASLLEVPVTVSSHGTPCRTCRWLVALNLATSRVSKRARMLGEVTVGTGDRHTQAQPADVPERNRYINARDASAGARNGLTIPPMTTTDR